MAILLYCYFISSVAVLPWSMVTWFVFFYPHSFDLSLPKSCTIFLSHTLFISPSLAPLSLSHTHTFLSLSLSFSLSLFLSLSFSHTLTVSHTLFLYHSLSLYFNHHGFSVATGIFFFLSLPLVSGCWSSIDLRVQHLCDMWLTSEFPDPSSLLQDTIIHRILHIGLRKRQKYTYMYNNKVFS